MLFGFLRWRSRRAPPGEQTIPRILFRDGRIMYIIPLAHTTIRRHGRYLYVTRRPVDTLERAYARPAYKPPD